MKHLKTINELHQDTYDSYNDKRLYNYLKDNHPEYLQENDIYSPYEIDHNDVFIYVSQKGHSEVVKSLLNDERVDPSDRNNLAIRYASHNGHLEVVKELLKDSRVDPSDMDNEAIRDTSYGGHSDIVKLLLNDSRVDPSNRNNFAIGYASENGHTEVVRILASDERVQQESNISEEELLQKYIK